MQCHLHFVNSFSNFVNRERVCSPGDNVKVTLDLNLRGATKIEDVHINVIGTAKNKFMKRLPNNSTKLVNGSMELLNNKVSILRNADLPTGTHKYRSSFTLPMNIPSSFKFSNSSKNKLTRWKKTGCSIKYKVQVIVSRAGNPLKKYEFPFDVVKPIDLNEFQPSLRKPRDTKTTISNGISGDFSMTASIQQRGFTPGENIVASLSVNNKSQIHVKSIEVSLIKKIILTSLLNSKDPLTEKEEEEWIITETSVECDEVLAGEQREFRRELKVPPLQPIIDNCELIQVCYRLWIRAKTSDANRRETLIIPIVIGTIPLRIEEGVAEPKLKLTIPLQSELNDSSVTCRCTCPCPHCARSKIITNAHGSPEHFEPQMVPQTPMSPLDKIEFASTSSSTVIKSSFVAFETSKLQPNAEKVEYTVEDSVIISPVVNQINVAAN